MIVLCGFPLSNYYNKVKMALLEKGVDFTEERVGTGSKDEAIRAASPLGKVPFIKTPQGALCESQVIVDWLEAAYPQPALVPSASIEFKRISPTPRSHACLTHSIAFSPALSRPP